MVDVVLTPVDVAVGAEVPGEDEVDLAAGGLWLRRPSNEERGAVEPAKR